MMKRQFIILIISMVFFIGIILSSKEIEVIELESETEDVVCEDTVINSEVLEVETELIPTESLEYTEIELLEVETDSFVKVKDYIPDIYIELKYNTTDNFTGQKIYNFSEAYLRYGTVKKLMAVQEELKEEGFSLKIWDAFRPVEAQFKLWEVYPNSTYVANPNKGFSSHSRGNTVDITMVDSEGKEVMMPTAFDDFSVLADRDYSDCTEETAANAKMLEQLMKENGFKAYVGEWWHFTDLDEYPVEENFVPLEEKN